MPFDPSQLIEVPNDKNIQAFKPEELIPGAEQIVAESLRANFDRENFAPSNALRPLR